MRERVSRSHPAEGVLIFRDQPTIVFVTICSRKRRSHLANDSVHNALVESWRTATAWLVGFYLIMPDHIHLFCAPNNEDYKIEEWVCYWKRRLRRRLRTSEALFQAEAFITGFGEMRVFRKMGLCADESNTRGVDCRP
jgi:putative transposase